MPYVLSAVRDIKGMQMKYIPGAAHRIPLEPEPSEGTEAATACIRYHAGDITPDTDVVMVRIPQSALTAQAMGEPRWYRGYFSALDGYLFMDYRESRCHRGVFLFGRNPSPQKRPATITLFERN